MKTTSVLFIFLLLCSTLCSQNNIITGQIIDKETDQPIEYATISVYSFSDSTLLDGTISDAEGNFRFELGKEQNIFLTAQFLGYKTWRSESLMINGKVTLDKIVLDLNTTALDEVVVTGRASTSSYKLDKQVFDAKQFQNAKGGNATDVLKNLPSVSVNAQSEISVRGATGFMIMINGRPAQGDPIALLNQLSANSIEDIEVVTAPSAKYDPDGIAGIINIKTTQASLDGMYINANLLAGLPSIQPYDNQNYAQRYGADFALNSRKGKWDFSSGLDYRRYDISGRREGYVNTYLNNTLTEFPSDGERSFDEINYSARASLTYEANPSSTISGGIYLGKRSKDRTADILYLNQQRSTIPQLDFITTRHYYDQYLINKDVFDGGEQVDDITFYNENLRVRKSDFFIASLDYTLNLDNKSSLKFSSLYERTLLGGPTDNVSLDYPDTSRVLQLQYNDNRNPLDGFRFQTDYSTQFQGQRIESGYVYRYLQHPGNFEYFDRDLVNNEWVENPLFTNSINLTRSIHAMYTQLSGSRQKFDYNVGLRLEYFDRLVTISRPDEAFDLEQLNLFPSALLGYNFTETLRIKAGYSRRIERTTTFKMTPFPEREHSETLEQGDAELLPEYVDLVEVGATKSWDDHSLFATAYLRNVNNVINRVNTVFNDTILNRIYTNVGKSRSLGLEFGSTVFPLPDWRISGGANIFSYRLQGDLFSEIVDNSNVVYSINANTSYQFKNDLTAQVAFNYLSERITAQGEDSAFYNPSLSLRKPFLNNLLAVGIQWLNIDMGLWQANEQRITTDRSNFFTTTNYVYEVDIVQLTLTYQLNQVSEKLNLPESEFGKKEF